MNTPANRYRVVIAQSILSEVWVTASDRSAAEDEAFEVYSEPTSALQSHQWMSDAVEAVSIDLV